MSKTQPIRPTTQLNQFKKYYQEIIPEKRNYALIILGLNTALHISAILQLRVSDVWDWQKQSFKRHLEVMESKTGKPEHISCHSLRKTFGYHAWKQSVPPAMLMDIYNHSSYQITRRYLGIDQDDKDQVFEKIRL